jgi:D-sedoheptulose 7-phosphate isomerase
MSLNSNSPSVERIWEELYRADPLIALREGEIGEAWRALRDVLDGGHQVLVCGNGGSASDSEHIAGELAKSCALERSLDDAQRAALREAGDDGYLAANLQIGFPVWPLVSQAALITAIANDQGGDLIFAQQVIAYGKPGDLLWVLSTSGNSANVIHALRVAKAVGMRTMGFTGPDGGALARICDVVVRLPGESVPTIQHAHQLVYHALCLAVEANRFAP